MSTPLPHSFRPLDGIKVIDLSHVIAGPFATFQLAQMGADVCKIETVKGGDVMRRSAKGLKPFVALNAGKRKLAVDLASAAGLEQVRELRAHGGRPRRQSAARRLGKAGARLRGGVRP